MTVLVVTFSKDSIFGGVVRAGSRTRIRAIADPSLMQGESIYREARARRGSRATLQPTRLEVL